MQSDAKDDVTNQEEHPRIRIHVRVAELIGEDEMYDIDQIRGHCSHIATGDPGQKYIDRRPHLPFGQYYDIDKVGE